MGRRLVFVALPFAAAGATVAVLALRPTGSQPLAAERVTPLTVARLVSGWRAPGVPVSVGGFAGAGERVVLRANGRAVASAAAGPLGRYRLRFAPRASGRYRLLVTTATRRRAAGSLVVRPVVVDAVGDVTFGEEVGPALAAHGGAYPWTFIAPTLRRADITVGNLETAVGSAGTAQPKEFTFRGPPSGLQPMANLAGFDALTLANNHSGDFGAEGLLETLRSVRAAGIIPFGAGADEAAARKPAVLEAGGLKVAFLGYSDVNPLGFNATASGPGTAKADTALIASDVRAARRHADVVVCFLHWGVELHPDPDMRQQQIAAACLSAGAAVVLGAHPHVLGPVSAPGRRSLIAWSLGNFVFPSAGVTARTGILQVHLGADGVRGFRLLPVRIAGFQPQPVAAQ